MENKISIGIIAYNEEKNIENVINSIPQDKIISEIIVVSSECSDDTEKIVKNIQKTNKKIKLISEKKEKGKYYSINNFIKYSKENLLILISADVTPNKNAIPLMCKHFSDKQIGIVASRPIPTNKNKGIINRFVNFQWELHHEISKIKPKYGEMIAFRKKFIEIPPTAVDEEEIARIIYSKGFIGKYESNAIVYNHGPENIIELIEQRKRIYAGHLELKKKRNFEASTMKINLILKSIMKIKKYSFFEIIIFISIELIIRILGTIDFLLNKNHYIWKICKSTKIIK